MKIKAIQIVLAWLLMVLVVKAQDHNALRVSYQFSFTKDSVKKRTYKELMYLDIRYSGESDYYSAVTAFTDSAMATGFENGTLDPVAILAGKSKYPRSKVSERVIKNYPVQGTYTFLDKLFKKMSFEAKLPQLAWDISTQTDTIQGYAVQKANTQYAGRKYEAWFTSEIPINEGPWKFSGLPGLILNIKDSQGFFTWEMQGIEKIELKHPIWVYLKNSYVKTTFSKYLPFKYNAETNVQAYLEANGVKLGQPEPLHLYIPIEKWQ